MATFEGPIDSPKKRSRGGCWTCKTKKVKCDEVHPHCRRCTRLSLECLWVDPRPSTSRKLPPARSSQKPLKWVSMNVKTPDLTAPVTSLPKIQEANGPQPLGYVSNASVDVHETSGSEENMDGWNDIFAEPFYSLGFLQSLEGCELFGDIVDGADYSALLTQELDAANAGPPKCPTEYHPVPALWQKAALSSDNYLDHESIQRENGFAGNTISYAAPASGKELGADSTPCANSDETVISLSYNFTKDPTWNITSILVRLCAREQMLMHLLLAASLRATGINEGRHCTSETISDRHFRSGSEGLAQLLNERDPSTNEKAVSILVGIYLSYLYWANVSKPSDSGLRQLSEATASYLHANDLLSQCTTVKTKPQTAPGNAAKVLFSWQDRTLMARLLVYLFYEDVLSDFQGTGGQLAHYLQENNDQFARLFATSRPIHLAHWAEQYPVELVLDDIQSSVLFDLLHEVYVLVHSLNRYCSETSSDMEEEFGRVEQRFCWIFVLTALEEKQPRPRLYRIADYVIANFYAARIYLSWYQSPRGFKPRQDPTERDFNALLKILHRTFVGGSPGHRKFQWPLLIAGAETWDPIQREWILMQMSPDAFKYGLQKIVAREKSLSRRLDVTEIRSLFSDSDSLPVRTAEVPTLKGTSDWQLWSS